MANRRGRPPVDLGRTKGEILEVRIDSSEKESFRAAAVLSGVPLSVWVREQLREASRRQLEDNGQEVAFLVIPQDAQ
jgi:hypothetical protein